MPKKISAAAPGTDASARDAGSDKHDEYLLGIKYQVQRLKKSVDAPCFSSAF
jgi:hypothetical protein